jgi:hypothetical protein
MKEAQSRLAMVGAEEFRAPVAEWFACLRAPGRLKLSVVGSHVLKGLLWYCALARDPAVTAAALPLLDTPWKPKRNLDMAMVALALLIDTMPIEEAWSTLLPLQNAWGATTGQIEKLVIKIGDAFGIAEAQLRAEGILKPEPPRSPTKADERQVKWVALASLSTP